MTWREAAATLQLAAERKHGAPLRALLSEQQEREDRGTALAIAMAKEPPR